ncbi:hypothetical protein [Singulisphaera acidiphila]|uniref:Uncharacterized protein n=1 Tax=Singulisphaera acidiphila (strain ATCC BAA-1392 / DSM 18658 / VKM B-2454 / MOB10) TaxID=886293 RepID=L0DGI2_SINAD|nr:hypothetical protein [Singulisphaera acidiphila]AGA27908.1 hypothetical protein Sinac_3661 [Singulisphaera acidiphila DSM 18658]
MDQHHVEHRAEGDGPGYEVKDANPRNLLAFGIVLVIFLTVLELGEMGVYRLFVRSLGPDPAARAPGDLYDQLRLTRETATKTLTTYGWVDAKAGIVRIPIERAMDLVVQRDALKGKGPKTEAELNGSAGTPVEAADAKPNESQDSKPQEKDQKP